MNADPTASCEACGEQNTTGARFCRRCGGALASEAAISGPGQPQPGTQQFPPTPHVYAAVLPPAALPQVGAKSSSGRIVGCILGACVFLLFGFFAILVAVALPNYIKVKEKAKEAEVKANLHNIQLSVERFAVDNAGQYPAYLIGGSAQYSDGPDASGVDFQPARTIADPALSSDPLLAEGYIDEYPRNPFTRDGAAIHTLQEQLKTERWPDGDLLRNGSPEGELYGTRFGPDCTLMGQVLADSRSARRPDPGAKGQTLDSYADMEYEFWDLWATDKPRPFLPGDFFYKSAGPLSWPAVGVTKGPFWPEETDQYMLGGYGGLRTKGKDVLGDEEPVRYQGHELWTNTASSLSIKAGSPYSPNSESSKELVFHLLKFGNPNGIRDSIVIVLTSGEDYVSGPDR